MKLVAGKINLGIRGFYIVVEMFGLWLDLSVYRSADK